jgi:hypothetical protein
MTNASVEKKYVTTTKNGHAVYVNLKYSHAATHLSDASGLQEVAKEVIEKLEPVVENLTVTVDMKRTVGYTDLVETNSEDEVIYAKRRNRSNYTRFAKNRLPLPSNFLTIVLRRLDNDSYELWSVWIGPNAPSFPGEDFETAESFRFWEKHALIWGTQEIQPGTETTERPW